MPDDVSGKRILVTGAGGWLGGTMAAWLADRGASVTALVRRAGPILGNDGRPARVDGMVVGDVRQVRLGLDEAAWRGLARQDFILHCAALTRFDADPALARAVNVDGTAAMVELARAGGAGLLHVSTAYVNGCRDGTVLETDPLEGRCNNVYEQTKAEAERVVTSSGIGAVIARPSIILGELRTGRTRVFGGFYHLFKLMAEGRLTHMPAEPWARLNLIPIDEVASGFHDLLRHFDRAAGRVFHIVSDRPTPLSAFADTLAAFPGLATPTFVPPAEFGPPANRVQAKLIESYAPYFRRNPTFDDGQFRRLTGSAPSEIDEGWWYRLVAFAVEAGFVRQASRTGPNGIASEAAMPSSAGSR